MLCFLESAVTELRSTSIQSTFYPISPRQAKVQCESVRCEIRSSDSHHWWLLLPSGVKSLKLQSWNGETALLLHHLLLCPVWCSLTDVWKCCSLHCKVREIIHKRRWGEIRSGRRKDLQTVMTFRAVTNDVLQRWCVYHSQVWLFLRHQRSWCRTGRSGSLLEGVEVKKKKKKWRCNLHFGLDCITSTTSSFCHSFVLIFPQNDDGPDVRAGSGDILLVHATETDRKGMVQSMIKIILTPSVCCIQDSMLPGFKVTGIVVASLINLQSLYILRQVCCLVYTVWFFDLTAVFLHF